MRINNDCWIIKKPIAHRGLHNETIPENSYKAFENAITNNYPIEMDIQLSKDGNLMVFHDNTLERMTGEKGFICNYTLKELNSLTLKNSNEKIPLFSEFLNFVNCKTPILIEIKNQATKTDIVEKTLACLKNYKGEYAIQSFNPLYILKVKKLSPETFRGLLATRIFNNENFLTRFTLKNLPLFAAIKPDFLSYDIASLPFKKVLRKKERKKCRLISWTIRNDSDRKKATIYAENIIFENIRP